MARKGFLKTLSITDIKGSASSANRGLIDLLMFKQQMRRALLAKGHLLFGSAAQDWIDGAVVRDTDSFALWLKQEQSGDRSWRSGRSAAEVAWLNMLAEVVFGRLHDAALKLAVKNSQTASATLDDSPGI